MKQKFLIRYRRKDRSAFFSTEYETSLPASYPDHALWSLAVRHAAVFRQSDLDNDTWELEAIIVLDQEGSDDQ